MGKMDGYQQNYHYLRPPPPPPPPPSADTNHFHNLQQPQPTPPIPPVPAQGPWHSNQFQYHSSPHSPSPPSHWAPPHPPPHSDHHPRVSSSYLPPPSHQPPYHSQLPPPGYQYPPPPHSLPHQSHQPPQIHQSYPQNNQDWGNPHWNQHHGWEYPGHNMEVDWAAKAKEWASAKTTTDSHRPQSQFPLGSRMIQEQVHLPQVTDSSYQDIQLQSLPTPTQQEFPVPAAHFRPQMGYSHQSASFSSGPSSHLLDGHLPHAEDDGASNASFSYQETSHPSQSVHQQEVPNSYSSVTGKEEITGQKHYHYQPVALYNSSTQEAQNSTKASLPTNNVSLWAEPPFTYGNPAAGLSDQPLDFAPGFNRDHESYRQLSYTPQHDSSVSYRGMDPIAAGPQMNSWTPNPHQQDATLAVSGHVIPPLGRFPGPNFQPALTPSGPFSLGLVPTLNPSADFLADAYGGGVAETPKKASVPNWLKEEIIKNASVLRKSSLEHPKDEDQSIEHEGLDKVVGNNDQDDSKNMDSLTTDEEDNEDDVEADKIVAINQEIKRVLTEVLLKVTDELFEEIATKVLNEDDLAVEAELKTTSLKHDIAPPSSLADSTSRVKEKEVVPVKSQDSELEGGSEKSITTFHGNLLGLANYDSDDDVDENVHKNAQNSIKSSPMTNDILQADIENLPPNSNDALQNSFSLVGVEENSRGGKYLDGELSKSSSVELRDNTNGSVSEVAFDGEDKESNHALLKQVPRDKDVIHPAKGRDVYNDSGLDDLLGEDGGQSKILGDDVHKKKSAADNLHARETNLRSDQNDRHESHDYRTHSSGKDSIKNAVSRGGKEHEKLRENGKRQDETHLVKEKGNDRNGSKEKIKHKDTKTGVKVKEVKVNESESRKSPTHLDAKEKNREEDRLHRKNDKVNGKRESASRKNESVERHNHAIDTRRQKRRRSSSVSSRERYSKENSVSHANDSNDDESEESTRRLHTRKRTLSPSPVRSRERQELRSLDSKHSQRRQSPYSSLETTRRRSRSRSKSSRRRSRSRSPRKRR